MATIKLKSMKGIKDDDLGSKLSGQSSSGYTIYWNNLTYQVYRPAIDKLIGKMKSEDPVSDTRTILKSISGSFSSGQMTALMGPSGAGKTTLLECLIGKRVHGLSGDIKVSNHGLNGTFKGINLAIVPQSSDFFDHLTVFETIKYSSQLKNSSNRGLNHDKISNQVIRKLGLVRVKMAMIKTLSGSERKRLAIGIEIVSKPNLLVLDEPTTGLDSFAAKNVIDLLHLISREDNGSIAVIMTIHQPSWNIMKMFDKVYMLSPIVSSCVFEGHPMDILPYLASKNLRPEAGITPPDYATDVASCYADGSSKDVLIEMATDQKARFEGQNFRPEKEDFSLNEILQKVSFDSLSTFLILFLRTLKVFNRDLSMFWIQLATCISVPLLLFFQVGGYRDKHIGCPPQMANIPSFDTFDTSSKMEYSSYLAMKYIKYINDMTFDINYMAINRKFIMTFVIVIMFIGLYCPLFMTKAEVQIVWRELKNNSYPVSIYYMSKLLADLLILTVLATVFSMICYPLLGGNMDDIYRPLLFIFCTLFMVSFAHDVASIIACVFIEAPVSVAIFLGQFFVLPADLTTGYFIYIDRSMDIVSGLNSLVFTKWPFDMATISYYGFDACGDDVRERVIQVQRFISRWIFDTFAIIDTNGRTIFGTDFMTNNNNSFHSFQSINLVNGVHLDAVIDRSRQAVEAVEEYAKEMALASTRMFIGTDGEVRSAGLVMNMDLIDSDIGRLLTLGAIQLVVIRMVAYFLFIRCAKARF